MTNSKTTKRALFSSVVALLLCFTMLLGTTFAWFTDSATSGRNIIQSGNLDVVLEYKTSVDGEWTPVTENTKLFKEGALYEPGYTEVVFLRVSNAGSLALKYNLNVNVYGETTSTNVDGEPFSLKDSLEIGYYAMDESMGQYLLGTMFGTREAALSNVTTTKLSAYDGVVCKDQPLPKGDAFSPLLVALVLTMPTTVGNEANHMTGVAAPTIDLGVTLLATQYTDETDSFGSDYDKDATLPATASNASELKSALENGAKNIILTNDLDLDGEDIQLMDNVSGSFTTAQSMFSVIGDKDVNIDLNGKTITVDTEGGTNVWSVFYAGSGANLTVTGGRIEFNSKGRSAGTAAFTTFGSDSVITLKDVEVEQIGEGGVTQMIYAHGAPQDMGMIYVEGGTYIQKQPTSATNPFYEQGGLNTNIIVSGGTYKVYHDVDLTKYMTLADGYKLELIKTDADGADWYTVVAE